MDPDDDAFDALLTESTLGSPAASWVAGLTAVTFTGEPVPVPPYADPDDWAAFAAQVARVPGGCDLWLGPLFGAGYGRVTVTDAAATVLGGPGAVRLRVAGAHQYAYAAFAGPLPPGELIRHRCDETLCSPVTAAAAAAHLTSGDAALNAGDREHRGRGGRHRHGVRRLGADVRDRYDRAAGLQSAVRKALAAGAGPGALPGVVEEVRAAGDLYRDQLALFPEPPPRGLRLLR